MSREIELKVPITEEQFEEITGIISRKKSFGALEIRSPARVIKSDEYFSLYRTHEERIKNNELKVIRIRTEKSAPIEPSGIDMHGGNGDSEKSYFCIKRKTLENGAEFNTEHETYIENPDVLRAFFAAAGYVRWFSKTKDAVSVSCALADVDFEAHLEIEKVNGLPYAEIEYTKEDFPCEKVRPLLERILAAFGIDSKKRDPRSWAEIIGEKTDDKSLCY